VKTVEEILQKDSLHDNVIGGGGVVNMNNRDKLKISKQHVKGQKPHQKE